MALKEKRIAPTPVRFPPELLIKLKKQAVKENRSLSNTIITIIQKYLNK